MVLGHCGAPMTHWIFLFHMAVFYIAFGYCWNDKHITDPAAMKRYIIGKFKMLYLPYIFCNLTFLLLNNIFVDCGIYASSTEYLDLIGSSDATLLHHQMTLMEIGKQAILILTLFGASELGGPTWFFASLLVAGICFCIIRYALKRWVSGKYIIAIEALLSVLFLGIAWLISEDMINFRHPCLNRLFEAYPLLVIGRWLRSFDNRYTTDKRISVLVMILSFVILLFVNDYGSISMARCKIVNPFYFLTVSLAGWFMLVSLSKLVNIKALSALGRGTRSIVMWHFISIKLVGFIYILVTGASILLLGCFPYIEAAPSYMWIIYTLAGTLLPYSIGLIYSKIKN